MRLTLSTLAFVVLAGAAAAQHQHHGDAKDAFTATPAFAPDGTLWVARGMADRVLVAKSTDLGKTFSAPVSVTADPISIDWGPDSRPQLALDRTGALVVTYAIFQDKRFNGRVYATRSTDGGASFAPPVPVTPESTSQRFQTVGVDPDGRVFAAWLDKRNAAATIAAGKPYPGAALAYAWADERGGFSDTKLAFDNTCECCRLGLAFAGPGRPAIIFRNVFAGSVRDHAVVTFANPTTPGPLRRVSVDDWKIEACPHHGPSLAIAPDGSYHAAWFTGGAARQGLFYARADNADAPFGAPRALSAPDRQPARPYVLATANAVHLVWKEFDGEKALVRWEVSQDGGRHWSEPRTVAETADASDHPLLIARGAQVFLSWLTKNEGYRLIAIGEST
ncbi:MAG: hypothetical protein J0J01_31750 [Reyranella sp.]|uniref:exo-alpha-sialidase n=1 Tax=Reyranella sp. TaxID=1929291 RepID=UPI001AD330F1|nr:exo-alpha-sialidase [Reyranella sp.]MBN9091518.1 hypothetical protein [Reyranella sp.]